jgi:hypothetical protein
MSTKNNYPASYYRNSKNWHKLLGQKAKVILATQVYTTSSELEKFLPYCFLILELESGKKIEIMGEAKTLFQNGEVVRLELRRVAKGDRVGVIPYGLKACKNIIKRNI